MYDVNIVLCILSANPINREQFVLSTSKDKLIFPTFRPNQCDNLSKEITDIISTYFIDYDKSYEDLNKIHLININSQNMNNILEPSNNTINILYGITIHNFKTNGLYYWRNFNFYDVSIPNELCIIGEVIKYGF